MAQEERGQVRGPFHALHLGLVRVGERRDPIRVAHDPHFGQMNSHTPFGVSSVPIRRSSTVREHRRHLATRDGPNGQPGRIGAGTGIGYHPSSARESQNTGIENVTPAPGATVQSACWARSGTKLLTAAYSS